ncbi:lim domain, putative [Entamoeba invadens IP1]|uniref:lim domain, putative n=1 Tax=Entamoeba invadens IP1 TaxID=370355 RepID=UPI0002C3E93F|nr:lim domain, putative [Entamoeba invadens IP1]ELP93135.1 lim domain, putative [Entamoeba invadens IP1]|eukprot:XP_004259906.1 lim domain, putative [Entamoeba invadens IP1]
MDCFICGKTTYQIPTVVIENKTKAIHKACFKCSVCGRPLDGYLMKGNVLCCVDCFDKKQNQEKCEKCGEVIIGRIARVDGKVWHPNCFVCSKCGTPLEGDFIEKDGKRLCFLCSKA